MRSALRSPIAWFAFALWVASAGLAWATRGLGGPGGPLGALVAITAAFAVTEMCLVHFEHRNEAQSLSFSAIPLVVGLFTLSVPQLVLARLLGSAIALVAHRRQSGIKLSVNLGSFTVADLVAIVVFHALATSAVVTPSVWPAAFAAAIVTDQIQGLVVTLAIGLHQRRLEFLGGPALLGPVVAVVDAAVALIALTLLRVEPLAVLLLVLAVPVLVVSYRVHARLVEKHRNLEQLYTFVRRVSESVVGDRVVATLLDEVVELMHADRAWICVDDGAAGVLHIANDRSGSELDAVVMPVGSIDAQLHARAHLRGTPALVAAGDDHRLASDLRTIGVRQLLLAPLGRVGGSPATFVVANRSGEVRDFDAGDLRLFATLVSHASTTLENDHLVDQLRAQAAESEHQALHDSLTGLPNRTFFGQRLVETLESHPHAAVLLLDLDRFKEVNDTLGHHNGDVLLRSVADRLAAAVTDDAVVARFGGDEFSVLLPGANGVRAERVVRDIHDALRRPLSIAGLDVVVGASIGIALAPDHGGDVATLLRRADVAMYAAKANRRGAETYDPARDEHSPDKLVLASRLRDAIADGDLAVHFQPQLDLATGHVIGAEALVRWAGGADVRVSPAELVAVAENTGLIRPLTMYVLERAVRQCRSWSDAGFDLRVSVNLSAHDLLDAGLVADVLRVLAMEGVAPESLCLELTETSVMADPARTVAVLHDLAASGIEVAVDDFGTGYSSLSYLRELPVSEVKIDRSFVMGMDGGTGDDVIVRSVVDLGRNLDLRVVAEGIETEAVRARLVALGCSTGQGYLYSRPLPAAEFAGWLTGAAGAERRLLDIA